MTTIRERIHTFNRARDWEQFHDPKNLSMALAAEAGELLELFQWLTPQQANEIAGNADHFNRVRGEIADVAIYLLLLADRLEIDLLEAIETKLDSNDARYPVESARGNATKHSTLSKESPS